MTAPVPRPAEEPDREALALRMILDVADTLDVERLPGSAADLREAHARLLALLPTPPAPGGDVARFSFGLCMEQGCSAYEPAPGGEQVCGRVVQPILSGNGWCGLPDGHDGDCHAPAPGGGDDDQRGEVAYLPFDQDRHLSDPPWKPDDPALIAWEAAHGHDVRLKCYPEFGCRAIENEAEHLRAERDAALTARDADQGAGALAEVRATVAVWRGELDSGAIRGPGARYCWKTAADEIDAALARATPEADS